MVKSGDVREDNRIIMESVEKLLLEPFVKNSVSCSILLHNSVTVGTSPTRFAGGWLFPVRLIEILALHSFSESSGALIIKNQ